MTNPAPESTAAVAPAVDPARTLVTPVASRLRAHLRNPLYNNVYALTLNTVASLLLGLGYWVLAARLYSPDQLGTGAAVISTMVFLSSVSQLNLNGAFARFLPTAGRLGGRFITYAYLASCAAAVVVTVGFLLGVPAVAQRVVLQHGGWPFALAFVVAVAVWSLFTLQDSVLTALHGALWVPVENTAFGIAKIVLLVLLASLAPGLGIFASWSVPCLIALIPISMLVFGRLLPRMQRLRPVAVLPTRRVLVRFVTLDYVGYLFLQAGTNALPVLVTTVLGAGANAVFYVGWLLGSSMELVAEHFGMSLTVESAANPARLATYTRQMLRKGLLLFVPGAVLLYACAPVLLAAFGAKYAQDSTIVLRLFTIAVVPRFIIDVYVAACRVQQRVGRIVLIQATTSVLVVMFSVLAMHSIGVAGVGVVYLACQLVVAVAVLPALIRLLRGAS